VQVVGVTARAEGTTAQVEVESQQLVVEVVKKQVQLGAGKQKPGLQVGVAMARTNLGLGCFLYQIWGEEGWTMKRVEEKTVAVEDLEVKWERHRALLVSPGAGKQGCLEVGERHRALLVSPGAGKQGCREVGEKYLGGLAWPGEGSGSSLH